MLLEVESVPVYFPYPTIYAEQLEYIRNVIRTLQGRGHALIEMPSGTGKTIALLASCVSYQHHCRQTGSAFKIVYCARTVAEVDKTLKELRGFIESIRRELPDFSYLGLGLTSRASMCINPAARCGNVDAICHRLISRLNDSKCDFYEALPYALPPGVYSFDDLHAIGTEHAVCPYYLVRSAIASCDCIVYTYNYIIDPAIYGAVSKALPNSSVIIFDEAHNIDSHCIEALSVNLSRSTLEGAARVVTALEGSLKARHAADEGAGPAGAQESLRKNVTESIEGFIPYFATDKRALEPLPGSLRNPLHFTSVLKRLIEFYKTKLKTTHLTIEKIADFVEHIEELTFVSKKSLQFCSQRLGMLLASFDDEEAHKLKTVAEFSTLLGTHTRGFSVIFEPYENGAFSPVLRLSCLDASLAISHVFAKFKNVVITSGTLSPIEMYPKILNFVPGTVAEIGATLDRNRISPLLITKGNDQMILTNADNNGYYLDAALQHQDALTTSFSFRSDPSVVRNYGNLLLNLARSVPDNIVCFFPSYIYMEDIVTVWSKTGVLREILESKLVFVETPDPEETALALEAFRNACSTGRGAIFLSVARGKVSEGVDFEYGYGRAVALFGVPFMYTESVRLKARLAYLKSTFGIKEYEFLVFDAMRHAAQCLGRVLRKKDDYGLMIMADSRFSGCVEKMPRWIKERIEKGNTGLSVDQALHIAKAYYREMAQTAYETE
ncbi:DNA excision repair protein ERCC-2 [Pancytospora philotis]|nr:DNA excision repair protein ERCC-2 [Pancytospora philotis]